MLRLVNLQNMRSSGSDQKVLYFFQDYSEVKFTHVKYKETNQPTTISAPPTEQGYQLFHHFTQRYAIKLATGKISPSFWDFWRLAEPHITSPTHDL